MCPFVYLIISYKVLEWLFKKPFQFWQLKIPTFPSLSRIITLPVCNLSANWTSYVFHVFLFLTFFLYISHVLPILIGPDQCWDNSQLLHSLLISTVMLASSVKPLPPQCWLITSSDLLLSQDGFYLCLLSHFPLYNLIAFFLPEFYLGLERFFPFSKILSFLM